MRSRRNAAVRTKREGGGVAPNRILSRVRALVLGVKGHGHGGGGSWELLLLPAGAGREGATDRPLVTCLSTSARGAPGGKRRSKCYPQIYPGHVA
jgi:hypothetical protein